MPIEIVAERPYLTDKAFDLIGTRVAIFSGDIRRDGEGTARYVAAGWRDSDRDVDLQVTVFEPDAKGVWREVLLVGARCTIGGEPYAVDPRVLLWSEEGIRPEEYATFTRAPEAFGWMTDVISGDAALRHFLDPATARQLPPASTLPAREQNEGLIAWVQGALWFLAQAPGVQANYLRAPLKLTGFEGSGGYFETDDVRVFMLHYCSDACNLGRNVDDWTLHEGVSARDDLFAQAGLILSAALHPEPTLTPVEAWDAARPLAIRIAGMLDWGPVGEYRHEPLQELLDQG